MARIPRVNAAHIEKGSAHFLRWDFFPVLTFEAEHAFIIADALVERADRDSKVVDFGDHTLSRRHRFSNTARLKRDQYVA